MEALMITPDEAKKRITGELAPHLNAIAESIESLTGDMEHIKYSISHPVPPPKPELPKPDPRIEQIIEAQAYICSMIDKQQQHRREIGWGDYIIIALISFLTSLSGCYIAQYPVRQNQTVVIDGIYTRPTDQSVSHSAIQWSKSWQNEEDRRAAEAKKQAEQQQQTSEPEEE